MALAGGSIMNASKPVELQIHHSAAPLKALRSWPLWSKQQQRRRVQHSTGVALQISLACTRLIARTSL